MRMRLDVGRNSGACQNRGARDTVVGQRTAVEDTATSL